MRPIALLVGLFSEFVAVVRKQVPKLTHELTHQQGGEA